MSWSCSFACYSVRCSDGTSHIEAAVLLQRDDGSSDTDASDPDKVAGLAADFRRRANLLYTLLQSNKLQSSQRAPYLRQFLLRINFNGFVENEAVKQLRQGGSMMSAASNA